MLRPGAKPRTYRLAFRGQNSYNKGKGKAPNANGIRSLLRNNYGVDTIKFFLGGEPTGFKGGFI